MTPRSSAAMFTLSITLAAAACAAPILHASPSGRESLGGGEPPDIELSTTSLPFGDVHLGGVTIQSVWVSNVGTGHLNVSPSITGGSASQFFFKDPLGSFQVSPGGQQEVMLCFFPSTTGTHEASLEFSTNDPVDPLTSVTLSGYGYEADLVSLLAVPNPVSINGSVTFTIVLDEPAGPADVQITTATTPAALIDIPAAVTVPQGATLAQFQGVAGSTTGTETIYVYLGPNHVSRDVEIMGLVGVDQAPAWALWLGPIAPNPVRRATQVAFALPVSAEVRLAVHDLVGRSVATLADRVFPAGRHEARWDPVMMRPGLYLVRLEALGETRVVKAVVTR